jgi:hypothetical protein
MIAGSDVAMQADCEKLWESYLAALHSSHAESASQQALLCSGMRSIAESLVACRFKPLNGGAGAALLALENSLRLVLQRLIAKQAASAGAVPDRCVTIPALSSSDHHPCHLFASQARQTHTGASSKPWHIQERLEFEDKCKCIAIGCLHS